MKKDELKQALTAQQKQKNALLVREFIAAQEDGATIAWFDIERATGVSMAPSSSGRALVRTVLRRLKREYLTVRGAGIRLSSASNAHEIWDGHITGVGRKIDRAADAANNLRDRHLEEMSGEAKARLLTRVSWLGALRNAMTEAARGITGEGRTPALPKGGAS